MILVGTSGFQYREWVPVFYPKNLSPGSWLRFYSRQFRCCELGLTYYRIPENTIIQEFIEETRGAVQFVVRVPFQLLEGHPENARLAERLVSALWPLKDEGQLAGALARFSPEFGFMRDNFEHLCRLRDALQGIPLIAEFGSPDWLSSKAARHLSAAHIALACVDGGTSLREKVFYCATTELAYVRLQGRNHPRWVQGDGSEAHDYLYSRAELAVLVPELRRLEQESERVLVFMGNHWRGQAVINARMLLEQLGVSEP